MGVTEHDEHMGFRVRGCNGPCRDVILHRPAGASILANLHESWLYRRMVLVDTGSRCEPDLPLLAGICRVASGEK